MQHIILNHALLEIEKASISVQDRGFRYGDGIFETIRVQKGMIWRFEWHKNRLQRGLQAIRINYPLIHLEAECQKLLQKNDLHDGLLRIQITRGEGGRGYLPEPSPPTCVIETMALPDVPKQPVSLWQSSYIRVAHPAMPTPFKLCQGLPSTLARMEASENECFDALMLNQHNQLCETSSGNVFWLKNDVLYTPSLDCGAVEGAMRAVILECSPFPVVETSASIDELAAADAVMISNVSWQVLAVNHLEPHGMMWQSHDSAEKIRHSIQHHLS